MVPQYYARDEGGVPSAWVRSSKHAMMSVIPRFNMRRVLFDYTQGLYQPAAAQYRRLSADALHRRARAGGVEAAGARGLAARWPEAPHRCRPRPAARRAAAAARGRGASTASPPADVRVEFVARRLLPDADLAPPPLSSYGQGPREGLWHGRAQGHR